VRSYTLAIIITVIVLHNNNNNITLTGIIRIRRDMLAIIIAQFYIDITSLRWVLHFPGFKYRNVILNLNRHHHPHFKESLQNASNLILLPPSNKIQGTLGRVFIHRTSICFRIGGSPFQQCANLLTRVRLPFCTSHVMYFRPSEMFVQLSLLASIVNACTIQNLIHSIISIESPV